MSISHNDVMRLLRIGKITGKDPLIRDYVLDGMAMQIKAKGKAWAVKNRESLKNEMTQQHSRMARRAREMGLPALTYAYARGRSNIAGLLGLLAGNKPVGKKRDELPDIEKQRIKILKKESGEDKPGWPNYSSSDPPKKGFLKKALWKKKRK